MEGGIPFLKFSIPDFQEPMLEDALTNPSNLVIPILEKESPDLFSRRVGVSAGGDTLLLLLLLFLTPRIRGKLKRYGKYDGNFRDPASRG